MYADLGAIAKVIAPLYTAEGLSISFDADRPVLGSDGKPLNPPPPGWFRTIAIVSHSAGHSRLHHIDLPSDETGTKGNVNKTAIQGVVSMTTYGRRCLTCMVFNVSTGDDKDGNRDDGEGNRKKTARDTGPKPLEPYADVDFQADLPKFTKLIASGKKTAEQIIIMISSKVAPSEDQKAAIRAIKAPVVDAEFVRDMEASQ
jgi:hypothetical protein